MKPLPLPLRVAAGLAVTTAERVRELPKQVAGFPVTVASQVLQFSMRVQQHVTELAIKGDDALSSLRPVEDTPSWATFDEDVEPPVSSVTEEPEEPEEPEVPAATAFPVRAQTVNGSHPGAADPWAAEEQALAEAQGDGPAGIAQYDDLTLPQLRARLRRLSAEQLEELLTYERDHENRPSFIGMLARRLGNVQREGTEGTESTEGTEGAGDSEGAAAEDEDR
ncbi:lipid droplet-associated protein [Amycolatopsis minnesotensis]|uniref:Lipid droplet-associated protein n=1 Tax=Amycolatopsis minnesotensis TaxID=337894 RepID=A0ABP5CGW4_9PSEU